jgi:hypothetical protein
MYPHAIAEQLRRLDHDVEAITQRPELRTLADPDVFVTAQRERRSILTENIADFSRIADDHDRGGQAHHGLVIVDPSKYPRGDPHTIGRMVTQLDRLLREHPSEEASSPRHLL